MFIMEADMKKTTWILCLALGLSYALLRRPAE
jgi:hypothetical protein